MNFTFFCSLLWSRAAAQPVLPPKQDQGRAWKGLDQFSTQQQHPDVLILPHLLLLGPQRLKKPKTPQGSPSRPALTHREHPKLNVICKGRISEGRGRKGDVFLSHPWVGRALGGTPAGKKRGAHHSLSAFGVAESAAGGWVFTADTDLL